MFCENVVQTPAMKPEAKALWETSKAELEKLSTASCVDSYYIPL